MIELSDKKWNKLNTKEYSNTGNILPQTIKVNYFTLTNNNLSTLDIERDDDLWIIDSTNITKIELEFIIHNLENITPKNANRFKRVLSVYN